MIRNEARGVGGRQITRVPSLETEMAGFGEGLDEDGLANGFMGRRPCRAWNAGLRGWDLVPAPLGSHGRALSRGEMGSALGIERPSGGQPHI